MEDDDRLAQIKKVCTHSSLLNKRNESKHSREYFVIESIAMGPRKNTGIDIGLPYSDILVYLFND